VAQRIDRLRQEDRHARRVDVVELVVETERDLDAPRANPQPVLEPVVEIEPVEAPLEVSGGPVVLREELKTHAKLAELLRDVHAAFRELEAPVLRVADEIVVRVRDQEPLAHERMNLRRGEIAFVADVE